MEGGAQQQTDVKERFDNQGINKIILKNLIKAREISKIPE